MRFAKGHGTGNDFVVLPDLDGLLELAPQTVARICDRHTGLGADGILRVVPRALVTEALVTEALPGAADQAEWFMDYRNADGSVAEMCGNGLRVFARYLLDHDLAGGPELVIATRAGVRRVLQAGDGGLSVEMGPARVTGDSTARLGDRDLTGLAISVGNPHLACIIDGPVADIDLSRPPVFASGQFPDGANLEVLTMTGHRRVEMRVYERGSGVTLSCGTGAVATAVAAAVAAGEWLHGPEQTWTVDVPGGRLAVTPSATASWLSGPAVIIATGELDDAWHAGHPGRRTAGLSALALAGTSAS